MRVRLLALLLGTASLLSAGEQAAVRHVATLVAEGSSLSDLFAAVARAVAQAIDADAISVERIDADRSTTVIASLDAPRFPIGSRWTLDEPGLHASVLASGRPVRVAEVSVHRFVTDVASYLRTTIGPSWTTPATSGRSRWPTPSRRLSAKYV